MYSHQHSRGVLVSQVVAKSIVKIMRTPCYRRNAPAICNVTAQPQARPLISMGGRLFVDPIFNMRANDDAASERNGARLDNDAANFV